MKTLVLISSLLASGAIAQGNQDYSLGEVLSKDGTRIGYRQYGKGPGLVLVQGAFGTAHNYDTFAKALASDFTVYVPDRRGRGLSPREFTADHCVDRDVEDLAAVLEKTGAHQVFGLSSGALITLEAARVLPAVHKAAVYEPPFYLEGVPVKEITRFNGEVGEGKPDAAMATAICIVKVGPPILRFVPHFIRRMGVRSTISDEKKKGTGQYARLVDLVPSMRYDFKVVLDRGGKVDTFHAVKPEVLLLGGDKSPQYLKDALSALEKILPKARRIEYTGLDHSGVWNPDRGGNPEPVAQSLKAYFKD